MLLPCKVQTQLTTALTNSIRDLPRCPLPPNLLPLRPAHPDPRRQHLDLPPPLLLHNPAIQNPTLHPHAPMAAPKPNLPHPHRRAPRRRHPPDLIPLDPAHNTRHEPDRPLGRRADRLPVGAGVYQVPGAAGEGAQVD
jgi:hypothetical protein